MSKRVLAGVFGLVVLLSGCATKVANPVAPQLRNNFSIGDVRVMHKDELANTAQAVLPERYNSSVLEYVNQRMPAPERQEFLAWCQQRGLMRPDNAADNYLAWRVDQKLEERLPAYYRGPGRAGLDVTITGTVFPNAATIFLAKEMIHASFRFQLRDERTGALLMESVRNHGTDIKESFGGRIGGTVGLLARANENQHIVDLDSTAEGIAVAVMAFVADDEVTDRFNKDVRLYPEAVQFLPQPVPLGANRPIR